MRHRNLITVEIYKISWLKWMQLTIIKFHELIQLLFQKKWMIFNSLISDCEWNFCDISNLQEFFFVSFWWYLKHVIMWLKKWIWVLMTIALLLTASFSWNSWFKSWFLEENDVFAESTMLSMLKFIFWAMINLK